LGRGDLAFLDRLAAGTAAPGGGSAAAAAGAAAAALVAMVARLTVGKKKYAAVEAQMQATAERAEALRGALTAAVTQDAKAFEAVMDAFRLPKSTPEEEAARARAIEATTLNAARVPLQVAERSVEVLELAAGVVARGNLNAISDGGAAAALAQAALTGSSLNVRINAASLQDKKAALELLGQVQALETIARGLQAQVRAQIEDRGGLSLE
jgi:glutamate formiminotransferase/formiminotetrahydrofolate cyclodeaminase